MDTISDEDLRQIASCGQLHYSGLETPSRAQQACSLESRKYIQSIIEYQRSKEPYEMGAIPALLNLGQDAEQHRRAT